MKILIASLFALGLLGATAASADDVGVGAHVGDVGVHAGIGGDHHDRYDRGRYDRGRYYRHHRHCVRWVWRNHRQDRYCRRWGW